MAHKIVPVEPSLEMQEAIAQWTESMGDIYAPHDCWNMALAASPVFTPSAAQRAAVRQAVRPFIRHDLLCPVPNGGEVCNCQAEARTEKLQRAAWAAVLKSME